MRIITKYYGKRTLNYYLKKGKKYREEEALQIMKEIWKGLEFLRKDKKIEVHGNLVPSAIWLGKNKRVRLTLPLPKKFIIPKYDEQKEIEHLFRTMVQNKSLLTFPIHYSPLIPGFKFERFIGKGSFGEVFLYSSEIDPGNKIIIKQIKIQQIGKLSKKDKLAVSAERTQITDYVKKNEAQILSEITRNKNCPLSIIKFVLANYYQEDGSILVFLEFCGGGDLKTFMNDSRNKKKISSRIALQMLYNILLSLDFLQSFGKALVHGDIKPANLLLSEDFVKFGKVSKSMIKLCDFGLFLEFDPSISSNDKPRGAKLYWAPEQILEGQLNSPLTDIWSLGLTFLQLVSFENLESHLSFYLKADDKLKIKELICKRIPDLIANFCRNHCEKEFLLKIFPLMLSFDFKQRKSAKELLPLLFPFQVLYFFKNPLSFLSLPSQNFKNLYVSLSLFAIFVFSPDGISLISETSLMSGNSISFEATEILTSKMCAMFKSLKCTFAFYTPFHTFFTHRNSKFQLEEILRVCSCFTSLRCLSLSFKSFYYFFQYNTLFN